MAEVAPEDYTWSHATKDLALMTPLTLRQALEWTEWARELRVQPYDALPPLLKLVQSLPDVAVGPAFFTSLMDLLGPT